MLPGVSDAIAYVRKLSSIPGDIKTQDLFDKNDRLDSTIIGGGEFSQYLNPVNRKKIPDRKAWLTKWEDSGRNVCVHAFVTGSLHLVGRALDVLENGDGERK